MYNKLCHTQFILLHENILSIKVWLRNFIMICFNDSRISFIGPFFRCRSWSDYFDFKLRLIVIVLLMLGFFKGGSRNSKFSQFQIFPTFCKIFNSDPSLNGIILFVEFLPMIWKSVLFLINRVVIFSCGKVNTFTITCKTRNFRARIIAVYIHISKKLIFFQFWRLETVLQTCDNS